MTLPRSPFILVAVVLAALVAIGLLLLSWRALGSLGRAQRVALAGSRLLLFAVVALGLADLSLWRTGAHAIPPYLAVLVDASQSMSIPDATSGQTRLAAALAQLRARAGRDQLGAEATFLTYGFAQEAHRTSDLGGLKPTGARTDLAAAVAAPADETGPRRLSAIVLITDGQDTEGSGAADVALAARGLPVYTVGVGAAERPRDLELGHVLAPKQVARGEQAEVVARLRAYGYESAQAKVALRRGDREVASQTADLRPGEPKELRFRTTPGELGLFRYSVRVQPLADELSDRNNERTFFLRVTQGDRKVLLVDRPRQEFAALRRALEPLEKLNLTIYLKKDPSGGFWREQPSPAKGQAVPGGANLARYDAIIIGHLAPPDVGRSFLAEASRLVRSKGLGLGLLGGSESLPSHADTPLSPLLPFSGASGYQPTAAQVRLSEAGQTHPALAAVRGEVNWPNLPALAGLNVARALRPGAVSLLTASPPGRASAPLVAVRRVGSAKVLAVATDSTWRWVRSEHATEQTRAAHAKFWRALVWWLSTIEAERGVSVQLNRDTYAAGDAVRIAVTVRDEAFAPVGDAQVTATVKQPDGSEHQVACYPVPDAPGRYEGTYRTSAEGAHKVSVQAKRGGTNLGSAEREFAVEPQAEEFRRPEMNEPLLEEIARRTGGAYVPLSRMGELADLIQAQPREITLSRRLRLAHLWPYLALFLALAALDWGLRRRWGVG